MPEMEVKKNQAGTTRFLGLIRRESTGVRGCGHRGAEEMALLTAAARSVTATAARWVEVAMLSIRR